MLLLAADTSGREASIGISQFNMEGNSSIIEAVELDGGSFSAQLIPSIAALLRKHGLTKSDLGGFAVVSGPGSFTGLRVGLAAIKGLAEILNQPIAAISLLEAVALSHGVTIESRAALPSQSKCIKLVSAVDAGRNQIYAGEYDIWGRIARPLNESLLSREEFAALAKEATVVSPNRETYEIAEGAGACAYLIAPPDIGLIARMGFEKIMAQQIVSVEGLEAAYLVRPNSETFVKSEK
jgi:tRNA threonylcarbamoyladenosine biosynthesis protein TsaB